MRDQDEARELVDPAQLIREDFGGDLSFAYVRRIAQFLREDTDEFSFEQKHDQYFPALVRALINFAH